jgi:hypothetical protein
MIDAPVGAVPTAAVTPMMVAAKGKRKREAPVPVVRTSLREKVARS